jgi:hypothetical protein
MSGDEWAPWGVGTIAHADKRVRSSGEQGGEGYKSDVEMGGEREPTIIVMELVRVEKTTIEGIVAFKYAHTSSIIWDPNTTS